ncbi:MAG: hypothetical protein U0L71_05490 [Eggerthellaceae bacterium]|nr:hypothetical protein [Eggerthellaceae bacterium]
MTKNYTLKPTYTPVTPRGYAEADTEAAGRSAGAEAGAEAGAKAGARLSPEQTATQLHTNDCIRPENEDDDGYDPYSDRIEPTPLFEPDPWE